MACPICCLRRTNEEDALSLSPLSPTVAHAASTRRSICPPSVITCQPLAACDCMGKLNSCVEKTRNVLKSEHSTHAYSMVPKFFGAGLCWQSFANLCGGSPPTSINLWKNAGFAGITGAGGGLGVAAGNCCTHMTKLGIAKWCPTSPLRYACIKHESVGFNSEMIDLEEALANEEMLIKFVKKAIGDSIFYGTAAFFADGAWQLIVNYALHIFKISVAQLPRASLGVKIGVMTYTGAIAAAIFLAVLTTLRYFPSCQKMLRIDEITGATFASDFTVSFFNVFAAAATFVFTLFLAPYMGVGIMSALLAGLSTLTGYATISCLEVSFKLVMEHCGCWDSARGWKKWCCNCSRCAAVPCFTGYFPETRGGYVEIR